MKGKGAGPRRHSTDKRLKGLRRCFPVHTTVIFLKHGRISGLGMILRNRMDVAGIKGVQGFNEKVGAKIRQTVMKDV